MVKQIKLEICILFGFYIFLANLELTTSQIKPATDDVLTCQYRDTKASPKNFAILAAFGCYSFTRPDLVINRLSVIGCIFDDLYLPALNVSNNCDYKFSHTNPTIQAAVLYSFADNQIVYNQWLSCSEDAVQCCENYLLVPPIDDMCSPVWDGWTCFTEHTRAGEIQKQPCPEHSFSGTPPQNDLYTTKLCFENATWNMQTDYTHCAGF